MTIRKTWRLLCLTFASFFWASCSNDSATQVSESELPDSDSSTGADGDHGTSDSSKLMSSSSTATAGESASSSESYVLASDPSVTCELKSQRVEICESVTKGLTCDDYKRYLVKDTTLSQKILMKWEEELETCGAIQEMVTLYGVAYNVCGNPYVEVRAMKCSDGNTYTNFKLDGNQVSISSSSSTAAESSSSAAADAVKNCPQEGFALFADILAEVQKKLYQALSDEDVYKEIIKGETLTEAGENYIKGLLDHENQALKGNLSPYIEDGDFDVMYQSLKYESENWFDGYIAKTKVCSDGSPETTKRYQDKYDAILDECIGKILTKARSMKE